ncbi:MAG: TrkA family potassium uptake protein [Tissierellia bacterium]|nr:TrkA family potassium uptake protein [Tissierellia bacterium]
MKDYAVLGCGRFGRTIATKLSELNQSVLLVDNDEDTVDEMSKIVTHAVFADITQARVLESLGLSNFDVVIIAISSNFESSIVATVKCKELGVETVIAKAKDQIRAKILKRVGADKVLIPEMDIANRTAVSLVENGIIDFINLSDGLTIAEVNTPVEWVGKSIKELDVRSNFSINIVAIKQEEHFNVSPDADYEFRKGDKFLVIGDSDVLGELFGHEE